MNAGYFYTLPKAMSVAWSRLDALAAYSSAISGHIAICHVTHYAAILYARFGQLGKFCMAQRQEDRTLRDKKMRHEPARANPSCVCRHKPRN